MSLLTRSSCNLAFLGLVLGACDASDPDLPKAPEPLPEARPPAAAEERASILHAVAPFELEGAEEIMTCYSHTIGNDAPLYVEAVEFQNRGSFHHSNWYVVPEDVYPGDDGYWPCPSRDFEDVSAALSGNVLFAQSTQAQKESAAFGEGVVIRIPARSKIVAGVHLLNLGPDSRMTEAWMTLHVLHPYLVKTTLSPIMLAYRDLQIPPLQRSRFSAACQLDTELSIYYALPHYHRAGDSLSLTFDAFEGGSVSLIDEHGFSASPLGRTFDPPVIIDEWGQLTFSCGYDNPHDQTLGWGVGINEMCVFLAYSGEGPVLAGGADHGTYEYGVEDDIQLFGASCELGQAVRGRAYDRPTRQEIEAPLRLPPSDDDAPEPPSCSDTPGTYEADTPPSFSEVQSRVLEPWCSFSSCHGSGVAAGLDVRGEQAYDALVDVPSTVGSLPRVVPSDPEGSALYRLVSECEPELDGVAVRHMPAGAPTLLEPELVGLVRAWIEAGAPR